LLANLGWQLVVELVRRLANKFATFSGWATCCQPARSISTCRDWNNKLATSSLSFVGLPTC